MSSDLRIFPPKWFRSGPNQNLPHCHQNLCCCHNKNFNLVSGNEGNMRGKQLKSFNFSPANVNHKEPGRGDLVYFESSPTFCEHDVTLGYQGTKGRECNESSLGVDGCDLMCCGRGYSSETFIVRERCACTFHWCCHVKCDVCSIKKVRYTCN